VGVRAREWSRKVGEILKKELFVDIERVREVLLKLGYRGGVRHDGFPSQYDEWVCEPYHVRLHQRGKKVTIILHKDVEFHIGRPIFRGVELKEEMRRIVKGLKHGR